MNVFLTTLQDLAEGLVFAVVVALFVTAVAYVYGRWVKYSRLIEVERERPAPAEPMDLAAIRREHEALRDRHFEEAQLGRVA